jgi:hypothetical protein
MCFLKQKTSGRAVYCGEEEILVWSWCEMKIDVMSKMARLCQKETLSVRSNCFYGFLATCGRALGTWNFMECFNSLVHQSHL